MMTKKIHVVSIVWNSTRNECLGWSSRWAMALCPTPLFPLWVGTRQFNAESRQRKQLPGHATKG